MNVPRFIAAAALVLLAVAASGSAGDARANGVPQLVKLTYLAGLSNWGPREAEGVLEFSFAEAYARVDVKNLKPADGFTYEGWLTGGAGAPLLVGKLTTEASGIGLLDAKLTNLRRFDYDTFIIAARGPAVPAGEIPPQLSIAGRFTVLSDSAGGSAAGDLRPAELPNTGEASSPSTRTRLLQSGFTMLAATSLVLVFKRTRKRRQSP